MSCEDEVSRWNLGNGPFVASSDVAVSAMGDEIAILDLRTSEYFTLNGTGAFLWSELSSPKTLDDLLDRVVETFDIHEEAGRADLQAYMTGLLEAGLVRIADG
ncbi:PqqD family protein [Aureimonas populi]|uniref:PqqD family protein n=1 Tax=Aureimonas populi TaxID=1701758 RepID=A0ABW5CT82_9HYPH|nr:PqqD family protein [Aureimonas populi]